MLTYTTEEEKNRLEIFYDEDIESPREWSNLGYFITVDNRYNSPDKEPTLERIVAEAGDTAANCDEHMANIKKLMRLEFSEKLRYIVPVSKYEHSAVLYRRGARHGWDEGVVGFYIVTDVSQKETWGKTRLTNKKRDEIIDAELETYTAYANGYVYRFVLYDENGNHADSCGGFYAIEDIKDYLPAEFKNEDLSDYLKY